MSMAKTGDFAPAGVGQLNAYQLWADRVNAAGGLNVAGTKRPVQLVVYDDQSDPGKAAASAGAVVGCWLRSIAGWCAGSSRCWASANAPGARPA